MKLTRRIAIDGMLASLSLIAFMLESLMPAIFLPGAKLGFANIFMLVALILFGLPDGFAILLAKVILGSLLTGTFSQVIYSGSAGVTALIASWLFIRFLGNRLSIISISAVSGAIHNTVQILVFALLNRSYAMLGYVPYLGFVGMGSGILVGFMVLLIINHLPIKIIQGA